MRYEVLYHAEPVWLPGEDDETRAFRLSQRDFMHPCADARYPDDYPGKVIAVREANHKTLPLLKNECDGTRPVIEMELSPEEVSGLRSRTLKIAQGEPVPVSLDDRWGAVAVSLREAFGEAAEEAWRASEADPDSPGAQQFAECAENARRALAPTFTHTGTGFYFIKATPTKLDRTQSGAPVGQVITMTTGGLGVADAYIGGYISNITRGEIRAIVSHIDDAATLEGNLGNWVDTDDLDVYDAWSTVQGAADQLLTDQGVAVFAAVQELRIFVGTYVENVVLNGGLVPYAKYHLLINANSGDTVTIDGGGGIALSVAGIREVVRIYGLILENNVGLLQWGLNATEASYGTHVHIKDCTFNSGYGIKLGGSVSSRISLIEDCVFNPTHANAISIQSPSGGAIIRRCEFHDGKYGCDIGGHYLIEGCVFDNQSYAGISLPNVPQTPRALRVANCVFYSITTADIYAEWTDAGHRSGFTDLVALNNIHLDSAYCYWTPSETQIHIDRNCIYNATKVARVFETDYTTLANWQAYVDEWGHSPDANSLASDPLLTNPAGDDFSLQAASLCRRAGQGAGVVTGINSVAFDPFHPDIGSWSSGVGLWRKPENLIEEA